MWGAYPSQTVLLAARSTHTHGQTQLESLLFPLLPSKCCSVLVFSRQGAAAAGKDKGPMQLTLSSLSCQEHTNSLEVVKQLSREHFHLNSHSIIYLSLGHSSWQAVEKLSKTFLRQPIPFKPPPAKPKLALSINTMKPQHWMVRADQ